MTPHALLTHLEGYLPLQESERQLIEARASERRLRRRQFILQEGFPCQHYTFVVTGCLRLFGVDAKGTEHNLQFAAEDDRPAGRWMADLGSFHSGKPSQLFIEALEPSTVLQMKKRTCIFCTSTFPSWTAFSRSSSKTSWWSFRIGSCKPSVRRPRNGTCRSWSSTRPWPRGCPIRTSPRTSALPPSF